MRLSDPEPPAELRRRAGMAALVVLFLFAGIGARLFTLQVGDGQSWQSRSERNRVRLERMAATRGRILDHRGDALADNRAAFDILLVPEDVDALPATLARIEALTGHDLPDPEEVEAAARRRPPFEGIVIEHDVPWETVVALETHDHELDGVRLEVGPVRTYPRGPLASHLVGYVGEVSEKDLRSDEGYRLGDRIGKTGAEKVWEKRLRGASGAQQVEVDARGRRLRTLSQVPGTRGESLYLTIDRRLQAFAEQLLADREGAIVAMRPRTGEVLALASAPGFDPNAFIGGIQADDWRALVEDQLRPLNNRALQGQYAPGSTFKIVTAAAALEEEIVTPETRIFCGGSHQFGNRSYRCWRRGGHGNVNLHDALVQSCDVYFYQVGQKLGVDKIAEYARRFGLGVPTGVEIENEKGGLIPTKTWKKQRYGENWYAGETLSVAIGQGYLLATPLQVANMTAAIANGGFVMRPQLVDRVLDGSGAVLHEFQPEVSRRLGLRPRTLREIRDALHGVVDADHGTGKRAALDSIEVAGKTGTVQVFRMGKEQVKTDKLARHLRDHAWFIAFAPVENPEIVIAVLVEHAGGGGGTHAAPLARDLADFWFALERGRDYRIAESGARAWPAPWDLPRETTVAREIPEGAATRADSVANASAEGEG